jgi:hypothetical protein
MCVFVLYLVQPSSASASDGVPDATLVQLILAALQPDMLAWYLLRY